MKEQLNKPLKQKYQTPVLQHFGSVTELTNSATGSCKDDADDNTCGSNSLMQMQV
jgi:hypothetical protein